MIARPDDAIAKLADFTRCLDPGAAIVDRYALEEVLTYLISIRLLGEVSQIRLRPAPAARFPVNLGGVTIGMVEQPDGSIRIVP